jgi:biotin carboxyl carrier protein
VPARTFVAKFEDREVPVRVEPLSGSVYRVTIDGESRDIDARRVPGGLSLLVEGRNHEVSLARAGEDLDLLLQNRRFRFKLLSEERARRLAARGREDAGGRREIKASMPGKVVDVLVAVGDAVEAKQGLLVLEAMKMENEIKAPGPGAVKEVRVARGQAVETGELLLVIE